MNDNQINQAVHEALGLGCYHNPVNQCDVDSAGLGFNGPICTVCDEKIGYLKWKKPKYTTDPRLWWPLAEEMKAFFVYTAIAKISETWRVYGKGPGDDGIVVDIWDRNPGRAVCLAYLETKTN